MARFIWIDRQRLSLPSGREVKHSGQRLCGLFPREQERRLDQVMVAVTGAMVRRNVTGGVT